MKFITKYGDSPSGKRRVYLTSHPGDFEKCIEKITGDIFKTHDCVIYYTEDIDSKQLKGALQNGLPLFPSSQKQLRQKEGIFGKAIDKIKIM